METKELKKNKGITLIALIITIIVLLILAGISIATLTGPNGLLTRANEAKQATTEAGAREKLQMEVAGSFDNNGNFNMQRLKDNLKNNLGLQDSDITDNGDGSIKVIIDGYDMSVSADGNIRNIVTTPPTTAVAQETIFKDSNSSNKEAVIPKGFKVSEVASEQKIDTGLVVIAPDGSEFVWVPVDKITLEVDGIDGKVIAEEVKDEEEVNYRGVLWENFDQATSTKIAYSDTGYREPAYLTDSTYADANPEYNTIGLTPQTLQNEYNAIIDSIKSKGGFYIGRYESSLSGSTKDTMSTTGNIQSKRNVMPTGADNTGTYRWYGLYAKHKEYGTVINSSYQTNLKSAMIYGSMYDAVMNWALYGEDKTDASEVTNPSNQRNTKQATGTLEEDKIKNIYDLGNNLFEWTVEANNTFYRLDRGR